MTNETLETIKNRRSCRAYKPEQITNEELDAVLEAAEEEAVLLEEQPLRVSALTVAVAAISAIKFLLVIFIYFSFQMRSF